MSRYRDDDDDYRRGGYGRGVERRGREDDYYGRDRYGEPIDYRADYLPRRSRYDDYNERDERGYFERTERGRPPERYPDERADYGRRESLRERAGIGRGRAVGAGASRSHVRCRDIMTREVTVATRETTLQEVAAMMRDEDTGIIPVVEKTRTNAETPNVNAGAGENATGQARGGEQAEARSRSNNKLVGLITDRDIVIRALADGRDARSTRAEEIMTSDVYTAQPNDRVIDVIRTMGDKQVRRIPVVDSEGNLRGIISMADVALETEEDRELANALEEISSGSSFWSKIFG